MFYNFFPYFWYIIILMATLQHWFWGVVLFFCLINNILFKSRRMSWAEYCMLLRKHWNKWRPSWWRWNRWTDLLLPKQLPRQEKKVISRRMPNMTRQKRPRAFLRQNLKDWKGISLRLVYWTKAMWIRAKYPFWQRLP